VSKSEVVFGTVVGATFMSLADQFRALIALRHSSVRMPSPDVAKFLAMMVSPFVPTFHSADMVRIFLNYFKVS
jgi:hypothetical protein